MLVRGTASRPSARLSSRGRPLRLLRRGVARLDSRGPARFWANKNPAPPGVPAIGGPLRTEHRGARNDHDRLFELARRWGWLEKVSPGDTFSSHPPSARPENDHDRRMHRETPA